MWVNLTCVGVGGGGGVFQIYICAARIISIFHSFEAEIAVAISNYK